HEAEVGVGLEPLAQQVMGLRRLCPLVDTLLDETELLDLRPGIETVAAAAALGLDEAVAVLPVSERRRRDAQHALYSADRVDGEIAVRQQCSAYLIKSWTISSRWKPLPH